MRKASVAAAIVLAIWVVWVVAGAGLRPAWAQVPDGARRPSGHEQSQPLAAGASEGVIALTVPGDAEHHGLIVVDATRQTVAVYHVHDETGQIALKSVRQIGWDLELTDFNSDSPLPGQIRSLLQVE